jgi:hypothetical protein
MELYFGSLQGMNDGQPKKNLVAFAIPDIGVKFKAPYPAENITLEYASLLTLLEFIEINPQLFTNRALELYSQSAELVDQIEKRKVNQSELAPLLQKALEYQARFNFSIRWSPRSDGKHQII